MNSAPLVIEPRLFIERQFLRVAADALPLDAAKISRNHAGYLIAEWSSPCPEIGSLWVSVTPWEIVLSNLISHVHFDRSRYRRHVGPGLSKVIHTSRILKRAIVRDSIAAAAAFLSGDTCATIAYAPDGSPHSYGEVPVSGLADSLTYYRGVFGEGYTKRAWNWFGEVFW